MGAKIYLLQGENALQALSEQPYSSEDLLQTLLEKYPDLLAGDQIVGTEPRRWLLISREVAVPGSENETGRWSLDHLFLDQDAVPTLVEVKRSSDTRIRREVVGQMLDYAANAIVYWPVEAIRAKFEARCEQNGEEPSERITELLQLKAGDEETVEGFWGKVKTNLQAGKVRLVFVADQIPQELRRIIEFLNEQMGQAEVLGVEVRQFVGDGIKTMVPTLIGQTAAAQQAKGSGARSLADRWDEARILEEMEKSHGVDVARVTQELIDWSKQVFSRIWWGWGKQYGSFVPILQYGGYKWRFFYASTDAQLSLYFEYLQDKPPFDREEKRLQWLEKINLIPNVTLPRGSITRYPSIALSTLSDEKAMACFKEAIKWAMDEVKKSPSA